MDPKVSEKRSVDESNKTPMKSYAFLAEWYNEIQKRNAIENNISPKPQSIVQSLGEYLGEVVIEVIPEDIMREFVSEFSIGKIPLHFGVTVENVLSKHIKLTPLQDDNVDQTAVRDLATILRVGDQLNDKVLPKREDELNDELELHTSKFEREKIDNMADEVLNLRCAELMGYESEIEAVVEKYNNEFIETQKSIEEYNLNKCKIKLERKSARLVHNMTKLLNASLERKDKELKNAFCYYMQLARNELFEEFQNEKLKLEYRCDREMETLKKERDTALEQLRTRLEKEHAQDLFELERRYENEMAKMKADDKRRKLAMNRDSADDGLLAHTLTIHQIDDELSGKRDEMLVYKKRLEYILSGYVDFVENNLQANPSLMRRHLDQAKELTEKLKETKIDRECCGNPTKRHVKRKSSSLV